MEEVTIEEIIKGPDLKKAIEKLTSQSKDHAKIAQYVKEYIELDRTIRDTQVGNVQKDKQIGEGENKRLVKSIRTPVNFQKKIVTTACAFEVGEPVTLSTTDPNDVYNELLRLWKSNRIDDKLQKAKTTQKSETECAIHFFIAPKSTGTKATQPSGINEKIDIKSNVLTLKNGFMSPYFDATNDMMAFTWQFSTKNAEGKDVNNTWVFDQTNVYKISDASGTLIIDSIDAHGFDRIPIVYMDQLYPEWFDVSGLIDRYEVALSKLGVANDYSGHPILLTYGDLNILPEMNDDGKTINFPIKIDEDTKQKYNGDAKFLTRDNAPEAVKLEMETIRELLFSITQTPDISFEKMKSIGAISGTALKLMFLDPMIKAKMNEGQNRTIVERIINILISGITGAVNVSSKSQTNELVIDIKFNSILPTDTLENSTIAANGFTSQSISREQRVKLLDLVSDVPAEVTALEKEFPPESTQVIPPTI